MLVKIIKKLENKNGENARINSQRPKRIKE